MVKFFEELTRLMPSLKISHNEALSKRTTFRIGGLARYFIEPSKPGELSLLLNLFSKEGIGWKVIGGGSNLLISDEGCEEPVISIERCYNGIFISYFDGKKVVVTVGGGLKIKSLMSFCLRNGIGGCEFLVGIPATVGGAIYMNASTSLGAMVDIVKEVSLVEPDGKIEVHSYKDFSPSYRKSNIPKGYIIAEAKLELFFENPSAVLEKMKSFISRRKETQPFTLPSAGCVFKNPPSNLPPAGWLIDRCGLKGYRVGDAQVSPKHANWIVNLGKARAKDVSQLIEIVKARVFEKFAILLEEEIERW